MAGVVGVGCCCLRLAERLTEACGPGMPGPYREVKKVGCQVGARCGGGGKTPPYEWKIAGRACPAPTRWLKESNRQQAGIPPALRRHLPLTREAGCFLLRISRKPSPLPLHNFRVSLIIYCKCTIRRGVPRCRQNHKNRCWESWEGWDPRPAVICIRC